MDLIVDFKSNKIAIIIWILAMFITAFKYSIINKMTDLFVSIETTCCECNPEIKFHAAQDHAYEKPGNCIRNSIPGKCL